jgi:ornithine cyclodeaminase/alanine dehydrogenase
MTQPREITYLSEKTLGGLGITTAESIAAIEALFHGRAEAKVWWVPKANVLPPDGRYMMATLAAADDPPVMVVKSVLLNARNAARGIPQINGLITVMDSETGLPLATMDANWITAVRTAALSAVAARRMARPDATVAAFIGCGVQARSHLDAFASMYRLTEIRMFGRGRPNIDALRQAAATLGLSTVVCETADAAMAGADLITTSVTFSATMEPFLDANTLKPGSFTSVTDLAAPWIKESFPALDRIVIDDLEQEAAMPHKLVAPELVTGDLSGLVLGEFDGRGGAEDRTAFIFRGHAIGDLALSALAYRKACDLGRGVAIPA